MSLNPNVAYLDLNLAALWKKQTTLPSLAYAGIPYQVLGERAGALVLMIASGPLEDAGRNVWTILGAGFQILCSWDLPVRIRFDRLVQVKDGIEATAQADKRIDLADGQERAADVGLRAAA